MIEIEFINSPDCVIIDKFVFKREKVLLGREESAHLVIHDKELSPLHFELYISKDKLFGRNCKEKDFFLVNGKKFSGTKTIKFGDEITIGLTSFRVLGFMPRIESEEESLKKRYEKISNDHPDVSMLLTVLEDELLRIQVEENRQV